MPSHFIIIKMEILLGSNYWPTLTTKMLTRLVITGQSIFLDF